MLVCFPSGRKQALEEAHPQGRSAPACGGHIREHLVGQRDVQRENLSSVVPSDCRFWCAMGRT